eukprot:CAMPEP_0197489234 /NCGR_PEP_ID=MMETSP1311-20131121/4071_1 /TAXON_ID=464262 /ORGANISM="Genus nov. species nov., Strain RCC856" /LENGTH=186 /DNA_ID=CAMNT_0043033503 /DNA_START=108 /DNA_END=668 /DNA_ORIENTATION=-
MEFEAHPAWTLRCKYFADVSNAEDLGAYIISGKCPERTSLINARLIPGLMALYAAGDKTLRALGTEKGIATRTMGSELVYNLSGSKHISESLRRFGVKSKDCKEVLVAWFESSESPSEEPGDISGMVKGTEVASGDDLAQLGRELASRASAKEIRKYYKVQDTELASTGDDLGSCVVFRIGGKEFL